MNIYSLQHIETPRLLIRPVHLGDEVPISRAIQNSLEPLQRWMPWAQDPSFETTQAFVQQTVAQFNNQSAKEFPLAVIHKADRKIIGMSGYNSHSIPVKPFYEIGYWIDIAYQGQGFVTEWVNALTHYALNVLGAHRVQICTPVTHFKSRSVAERCGFKCEMVRQNDHLDVLTQRPTHGYVFSLCHPHALPPLEISWQHNGHLKCPMAQAKGERSCIPNANTTPPVPLPMLRTERLKLIPTRPEDFEPSWEALKASVNEVGCWFSWANQLTPQEHHAHIEEGIQASKDIYTKDHLSFFVWDQKEEQLLGEIWYRVRDWPLRYFSIGYWFDTRHSGQGYATEALREMIRYAFDELRAQRIELDISEKNSKSLRVAQRANLICEGTLKNYSRNFITNEVCDSKLFALTELPQP